MRFSASGLLREDNNLSFKFKQFVTNPPLRRPAIAQREASPNTQPLHGSMANPPAPSQLTIHLADRALTPIISSQQSQSQAQALSSLTSAAITAYESASRLGLGLPQRIMIETQSSGPIVLHSYLSPQVVQPAPSRRTRTHDTGRDILEHAREGLRPLSGTADIENMHADAESESLVNGISHAEEGGESDLERESHPHPPPLLIASVVAPRASEAGEARRAAARLERTGREFQREWIREQEEALENAITPDADEG